MEFLKMEAVSVIGAPQVKIGAELLKQRESRFCKLWNNELNLKRRGYVHQQKNLRCSGIRSCLKASSQDPATSARRCKSGDGSRLFVGLPLDTVSKCNTVNHARAIAAGLRALKLMGVDGVELPVWWGVVEKDVAGKYEWSGYLAIAELVQKMGLKLHVSLCFHACREAKVALPNWVSHVGADQPIFFTDRSGKQYKDCLSLAVDQLPVLDGRTPVHVYGDFLQSFKANFAPFMGSTITGITMGLGPDGELCYPANHLPGAGEFQCYDKFMLANLKQHAEASGNPLWGLGGPHDAPNYDQPPIAGNFFREQGGSWETPYGDFFLSWYSSQLLSHGDLLLSLASSAFIDSPVTVSGKIPLLHHWRTMSSRPSELTAGFYNTVIRDGYEAVADMFARNSCRMILPGMDLSNENQLQESRPQPLLAEIMAACRKHGVSVAGQNTSIACTRNGFEQMKKNLTQDNGVVDVFTYQRMGATFFSPEHFPLFVGFVRGLTQADLHPDDMLETDPAIEGKGLQVA